MRRVPLPQFFMPPSFLQIWTVHQETWSTDQTKKFISEKTHPIRLQFLFFLIQCAPFLCPSLASHSPQPPSPAGATSSLPWPSWLALALAPSPSCTPNFPPRAPLALPLRYCLTLVSCVSPRAGLARILIRRNFGDCLVCLIISKEQAFD